MEGPCPGNCPARYTTTGCRGGYERRRCRVSVANRSGLQLPRTAVFSPRAPTCQSRRTLVESKRRRRSRKSVASKLWTPHMPGSTPRSAYKQASDETAGHHTCPVSVFLQLLDGAVRGLDEHARMPVESGTDAGATADRTRDAGRHGGISALTIDLFTIQIGKRLGRRVQILEPELRKRVCDEVEQLVRSCDEFNGLQCGLNHRGDTGPNDDERTVPRTRPRAAARTLLH